MSMRRTLQFALAVMVAAVALAFGTAAGATDNPDYTAPPPASAVSNATPQPVRQAADGANGTDSANGANTDSAAAASPDRQRLAITGSDTAQLVLFGAILVAVGAGTLVLRRRAPA